MKTTFSDELCSNIGVELFYPATNASHVYSMGQVGHEYNTGQGGGTPKPCVSVKVTDMASERIHKYFCTALRF